MRLLARTTAIAGEARLARNADRPTEVATVRYGPPHGCNVPAQISLSQRIVYAAVFGDRRVVEGGAVFSDVNRWIVVAGSDPVEHIRERPGIHFPAGFRIGRTGLAHGFGMQRPRVCRMAGDAPGVVIDADKIQRFVSLVFLVNVTAQTQSSQLFFIRLTTLRTIGPEIT